MNLLRFIETQLDSLAESEAKVAQVILDNPEAAETFTISRLAEEAKTSVAAVQRLCQSLGFGGYKELRYELTSQAHKRSQADESNLDLVAQVANAQSKAMAELADLDREALCKLADAVATSPRVFCLGVHRSSLPALKLRMDLEDLGICAFAAGDVVGASHLANLVTGDSCVMVFSVAGSGLALRASENDNQGDPAQSWIITTNPHAATAAEKPHVLVLPSAAARCGALIDDHAVMLGFVEILVQLVRKRLAA